MAKSVVSGINQVGNNYYRTKVTDNGDGTFSSTLFRTDAKGQNEVPIAGYGAAGAEVKREINTTNATAEEQKLLADPNSQLNQVRSSQVKSTEKDFFGTTGGTAEQKAALNKNAGKSNEAKTDENGDQQTGPSDKDKEEFAKENNTFRTGTRESYQDLRYPENLVLEHQDCIKFSILQYRPSLAKQGTQSNSNSPTSSTISRIVKTENGIPSIEGSKRLGTITLPIPAGISDSNSVDWQSDTLNDLQKAMGTIAERFISGGANAAEGAVNKAGETAAAGAKSGEIQQGLAGKFAGLAVGSDKLQQRAYGSIFNNNLELLFNGPTLRSAFTFNFKLSPRSEAEAKIVRKIIRSFKQAMAVKRSQTSLLLKSPHTFAISYLTSNQEHPYLNKFKECALISCNVDYTPEGTYMTYMSSTPDGRSMVSYNLSLTFQELEPIFDDEYGNEPMDSITSIGY